MIRQLLYIYIYTRIRTERARPNRVFQKLRKKGRSPDDKSCSNSSENTFVCAHVYGGNNTQTRFITYLPTADYRAKIREGAISNAIIAVLF